MISLLVVTVACGKSMTHEEKVKDRFELFSVLVSLSIPKYLQDKGVDLDWENRIAVDSCLAEGRTPIVVTIDGIAEATLAIQDAIKADAEWRFFRGKSEPSPEWTREDFDDSGWESGPSGFGYLRKGAPATHLEDMKNLYTSLYIRRRFEAPAVEALTLSIRFDDGFVVYLNGEEVERKNVPETLSFDAVAPLLHEATRPI